MDHSELIGLCVWQQVIARLFILNRSPGKSVILRRRVARMWKLGRYTYTIHMIHDFEFSKFTYIDRVIKPEYNLGPYPGNRKGKSNEGVQVGSR